ncbi:CCHC-type domain-containing protein [Camponotus japonicus]
MAEVRAKMNLSEVGIQGGITTRTAMSGALLIEVPGSESGPKADALASRMREVLKDKEGININRPIKKAEIRVRGLNCSIQKEEVVEAVAEKGSCHLHEIKAGEIRKMTASQGSLWLRLPLAAAKKAAEGAIIQIGWFKVKIDLLEACPLRCHKCLERGHVKERCPNPQDRSGRCYRCGGLEHVAKVCTAPPRCPICADLGRKADHILGSQQCTTQIR